MNAPAMVLLPMLPLPLVTTRTFFTWGMGRFWMGPPLRGIWGAGPGQQGRPYWPMYVDWRVTESDNTMHTKGLSCWTTWPLENALEHDAR